MTTRTVSTELTPAQRQAFEEAVERYGKSFFANADLIWKTLLGAAGDGWQSADTAPVWCGGGLPPYCLVSNGCHTGVGYRREPDYDGDPEWLSEDSLYIDPPVTHWMPLPASPKPTDTAEKEVGDGT